jgi:hypothetical protein
MSIEPPPPADRQTPNDRNGIGCGHSALTRVIAGWRWMRLTHVGAPSYLVLLKISPNADEHDAVQALEWWLRSPGREDGDVVEVV